MSSRQQNGGGDVSIQQKLDVVFKDCIDAMKPTLQKLHTKERQIVGGWIKKLCHISIANVTERKNRNLYSQILLQMLHKSQLKEPFTKPPKIGKLPTIPAYMAGYLDESLGQQQNNKQYLTPDWLNNEIDDDSVLSESIFFESYQKYKDVLSPKKRERFMLPKYISESDTTLFLNSIVQDHDEQQPEISIGIDCSEVNEIDFYTQENVSDILQYESNLQQRSPSPHHKKTAREEYEERFAKKRNVERKTNVHYQKNGVDGSANKMERMQSSHMTHEQLDIRVRMIETKAQEEKLKTQQEHDEMVKKILNRKNKETGDIKIYYQNKISEIEERLKKEESKAHSTGAEIERMRKYHKSEVEHLKEAVEKGAVNTATEYEKLMYDKLAEFEQEMFEMQKTHRQNVRDVLVQADEKMKAVKEEHNSMLHEMKSTITSLKSSVEISEKKNQDLSSQIESKQREKRDLKDKLETFVKEAENYKKKYKSLEDDNMRLTDEYETVVKELRKKSDQAFGDMKKERESSMTKTSEVIAELENKISQYRQTVHDMEMKRKTELKEKEASYHQQMIDIQLVHEKKVRTIESGFEKKELEYQSKIGKYEYTLKEKEEAVVNLDTRLKDHTHESELLIEEFRAKAEENSNRIFQDLNSKLTYFQSALQSATQKLEKQKTTFNDKYTQQRQNFEIKTNELQRANETGKLHLHQNYKQEKQILVENHKKEIEEALRTNNAVKENNELKHKKQVSSYTKTISDLEIQIRDLREQVLQANSLRKEQLQEVAALREEEKRTFTRNEESLYSKYKTQTEQLRLQLQKDHSEQMSVFTEKMNSKLRNLEEQYGKKATFDKTTISSLQKKLSEINQELLQKTNEMEDKMKDISSRTNEERKVIEQQMQSTHKKLSDELENQILRYKQLEEKYCAMEMVFQEKMSRCLLQSEEKMKGLLPFTVQKDLEETIETMREQITILKSRADLLQDELNTSTNFARTRQP